MQILIVPEQGWFGQLKYTTLQNVILRCIGLCFSYHIDKAFNFNHKTQVRRGIHSTAPSDLG